MRGHDTILECECCKKAYELTEEGEMRAQSGATELSHIPEWYAWERECVKKEILDKSYSLDVDVEIGMLVSSKALYMIGEGHLHRDALGFHLTGCDGKLDYTQLPLSSYSLYSDYYWYEIGDMICIGNTKTLYYCFPKGKEDVVAKTRLAAEELYSIMTEQKKK